MHVTPLRSSTRWTPDYKKTCKKIVFYYDSATVVRFPLLSQLTNKIWLTVLLTPIKLTCKILPALSQLCAESNSFLFSRALLYQKSLRSFVRLFSMFTDIQKKTRQQENGAVAELAEFTKRTIYDRYDCHVSIMQIVMLHVMSSTRAVWQVGYSKKKKVGGSSRQTNNSVLQINYWPMAFHFLQH